MKFILATLLTMALAFLAGLFLPWWSIAIIAFLVALFLPQHSFRGFLSGFLGIFFTLGFTGALDRYRKPANSITENGPGLSTWRIIRSTHSGHSICGWYGWRVCRTYWYFTQAISQSKEEGLRLRPVKFHSILFLL